MLGWWVASLVETSCQTDLKCVFFRGLLFQMANHRKPRKLVGNCMLVLFLQDQLVSTWRFFSISCIGIWPMMGRRHMTCNETVSDLRDPTFESSHRFKMSHLTILVDSVLTDLA